MKKKSKKKSRSLKWIIIILLIIGAIAVYNYFQKPSKNPEDTLKTYMSYIINKDYEKMYSLLSSETKQKVEKETYLSRNKNIYEGIEISSLDINIVKTGNKDDKKEIIYQVTMQTVAGEINFSNTSNLKYEDEDYKLVWSSTDIFPELKDTYKVRVEKKEAKS